MDLPRRQIFLEIRTQFNDGYKSACEYCSAMEKLSTVREQINFNHRCKITDVLPPSLKFSPPIQTKEAIDYNFGIRLEKMFRFFHQRKSQKNSLTSSRDQQNGKHARIKIAS